MSNQVKLVQVDEQTVAFQGNTYPVKDRIKVVGGAKWNPKQKHWEAPMESLSEIVRLFPNIQMDEQIKAGFQELQKRVKLVKEIKQKENAEVKIKGLKAKLYPYQAVGVEFLDTLKQGEGAILAYEMGLGKSLTSLAMVQKWINEGVIDYCLVVCPSPLKYATWKKEVEKWTDLSYIVVDGSKPVKVMWDDGTTEKLKGQRLREVQYQQWMPEVADTKITIVNYELFRIDYDLIVENMPVNHRWCVILDECHRIKNPKAKTTKNLRKALKGAGRKILATGTPLENNLEELWASVDFCRPNLLGNYYKFTERYMLKDYWGKVVGPNTAMIDDLMERLETVMLRKTKEEALPHLPPLTVQEYWVDMTKPQRKLYKEVVEGIVATITEQGEGFTYMDALAQITRLQQVCDSPALLRELTGNDSLPEESGKLKELANIIEDISPNKFVLFSQYRQMTDILYKWLQEKGLLTKDQIGYVKGGMTASEIEDIQNGFQHGDIQCVLMTTAGNYGLDLSAGSYVIAYDQLFNPQKMEQIYARCHRNGAKSAITAINLVTRDSYEERKLEILQEKRELFKAVIDNDEEMFTKLFRGGNAKDLLNLIA